MIEESTVKGITELRYIILRKIKKIREIRKKIASGATYGLTVVDEFEEYFIYNEKGVSNTTSGGIKIVAADIIAFYPSGIVGKIKIWYYLIYIRQLSY